MNKDEFKKALREMPITELFDIIQEHMDEALETMLYAMSELFKDEEFTDVIRKYK